MVEWHDIPSWKVYVVTIESYFFSHRKWTFRLKYRQTDRKLLKFIENGCTHCALRLFFKGKFPH